MIVNNAKDIRNKLIERSAILLESTETEYNNTFTPKLYTENPPISIYKYIQRIMTLPVSNESLILTVLTLSKLEGKIRINAHTIHLLFLGVFSLQVKFHEDDYPCPEWLARIGGTTPLKILEIELFLLKQLNYELYTKREDFYSFLQKKMTWDYQIKGIESESLSSYQRWERQALEKIYVLLTSFEAKKSSFRSIFHLTGKASISIKDYVERIRKYLTTSTPIFIAALKILVDLDKQGTIELSCDSIHQLFLTAEKVLTKTYIKTTSETDAFYASVGGMTIETMQALEGAFRGLVHNLSAYNPFIHGRYLRFLEEMAPDAPLEKGFEKKGPD